MVEVMRSQLQRYGIAVVAVAQALLLKLLLTPQIDAENAYLLFFVAVIVSAGYGGFGPGLLATVLTAVASAYLISPTDLLVTGWDEILWLVFFVLLALLITVVAAAHKLGQEILKVRAHQQAAVAELGQRALRGTALDLLINEVVCLVAQTLEVECCKLLELLPGENALLLRAAVGWPEGVVGQTIVEVQDNSHAGYTLLASEPVIIEDWGTEMRFPRPSLQGDHPLISGMSVIVGGQNPPFGVLGVYTTRRRSFTQDDINFLQAIANVLAEAINRKRVEEALSESEEQYRSLVELSPDTVFVQTEGKVVFVNQTGATLLGAGDPKELLGKSVMDIVHPDCRELVRARMRQVLEEAKSVPFLEEKFLRLDGSSVDVEVAAIAFSYNGQPAAQAVVRDITQRKRAEEVLRESKEHFRLLVEGVQDYAIFMLDPNGQVISWNPGAERILGYQAPEILRQPFSCLFTPADIQQGEPQKELHRALTTGRSEDERWHVRKDGSRFWAAGIITPLQDGSCRGFAKVMRDITERKLAESEREQLLEREQVARAQAEAANQMKDEFLATLSHELRTPLNAILGWARLLRTRKFDQPTVTQALETIERNAKSQAQLVEDLLDVSRIVQGKLQLNLSTCDLLPVVKAAIEAVHPLADAQAISLGFKVRPTSDSGPDRSTDFGLENTGEAQETIKPDKSTVNPTPQRGPRIQNPKFCVLGDSNRLQQVIWNLLSNAIKFTPAGGQIEVRLSVSSDQAESDKFSVGAGVAPEEPLRERPALLVPVGSGSSELALPSTQNSNAPVTSFRGAGTPTQNYAQIQVSDTGKGISPDFLPYVFERFRQFDSTSTRVHGGIGLGLAIVRQLVELHGGTVKAESAGEGQGAQFTVSLPLTTTLSPEDGSSDSSPVETGPLLLSCDGHSAELSTPLDETTKQPLEKTSRQASMPDQDKELHHSSTLQGLHVLVVDDEADARKLLSTVLDRFGGKTTTVASAREAMAAIEDLKPDVLVSDIGMPGEDGYALIGKLRALETERGRRQLPAIALTAYASEKDCQRALAAGFHRYLPKPVELADLVAMITDLAGRTN